MNVLLDSDDPDPGTTVVDALPIKCTCGASLGAAMFGLGGGGIGWYAFCSARSCGRLYKVLIDDEDGG